MKIVSKLKIVEISVFVLIASLVSQTAMAKKRSAISSGQYYINGTCHDQLVPDYAVIIGGLSVENSSLKMAIKELNKKVSEIKKITVKHGAKISLTERVRYVREAKPRNQRYKSSRYRSMKNNLQSDKKSAMFTIVQRIEVQVPSKSDIDKVAVGLMENGLQNLGKKYGRFSYRTRQVFAYFRFNKLEIKLDKIRQACLQSGIKNWCAKKSVAGQQKSCIASMTKKKADIQIKSFSLQLGPFAKESGSHSSVYLRYPWNLQQIKQLELISDSPTNIRGQMYMWLPKK